MQAATASVYVALAQRHCSSPAAQDPGEVFAMQVCAQAWERERSEALRETTGHAETHRERFLIVEAG